VRRALAALAAALTALALVTACGNTGHEQGPAGRVVAKDKDRECHSTGTGKKRHRTCDTEYELTTRDKQGDDHEFDVPSGVYDNCRRGRPPKCINR
jgi:hypothetical protein